MSTINTSGIDANYPIPGQNNSTQGFRDNFALIKQNLNTAATEITDLQNKAVLKTALANSTVDNNMANTLIANASTLQFRATTYNLGNALIDSVMVSCVLGDVQYGTLSGNIILDFGSWIPTNTWGGVELQLSRPNAQANFAINWPAQAIFDGNHGFDILENSVYANGQLSITFPHDVTTLHFKVYSNDCGNTLYVQPTNRPFKATQVYTRTPPSTGQLGDLNGTLSVGANVAALNVTSSTGNYFATANTANLYTGMAVNFTGNIFEPGILPGATYYVGNIANSTHFTVSPSANAVGNVSLSGSSGNMAMNPVSYLYIATDTYSSNSYNRSITSITSPNVITANGSLANLAVGNPIIFTGLANSSGTGNLTVGQVYYIASVSGANITISPTLNNGQVGPEVKTLTTVAAGNVTVDYTVYDGPDIFRKIPLTWGTSVPSSAAIANVSDIRIGGGNNGYYLQTDGTGNLAWAAGGGSGSGVVAGGNTQVQFNNSGSFGAATGFTFNSSSNLLSVPGGVTAAGNVTGSNFTVNGNLNVAGNTSFANLTTTGTLSISNLTVSGQVTAGGNMFTSGNIATDANLSVVGYGILGNLTVTSNATIFSTYTNYLEVDGNVVGTGAANIAGNIHTDANVSANGYILFSSKDALTATGTTQSDALGINCAITIVASTPSGTGVRLPDAATGMRLIIRNNGGNSLNVYPATGDKINSLSTNLPYSLPTITGIEFYCANATANQWYTL